MGAASDAAALALAKGVTRMMLYLSENEPERFARRGMQDVLGLALDLEDALESDGVVLSDPSADAVGKFRADAPSTSRNAAVDVFPRSGTQRKAVLDHISASGGATDEEIQEALDIGANSERPRRVELVEGGWVEDSGRTRETVAGLDSIVWTLTDRGRESIRSAE